MGGVNAISGLSKTLPISEPDSTQSVPKSQDYIVTPKQQWLDGIANEQGRVSQFVAASGGSGYSVESQITGLDAAAGIAFEIVPSLGDTASKDVRELHVKWLTGKVTKIQAEESTTIKRCKEMIHDAEGIPVDQQRLFFNRMELEDGEAYDSL